MKAMLINENKDLVWSEVEKPTPKSGEILIKILGADVFLRVDFS